MLSRCLLTPVCTMPGETVCRHCGERIEWRLRERDGVIAGFWSHRQVLGIDRVLCADLATIAAP